MNLSSINSGVVKIPGNVKYVLRVILLLLALNFMMRLGFLMYNSDQTASLGFFEILHGVFIGIRFDMATILLLNAPIFLFLLLPLKSHRKKITFKITNIVLLVVNIPVLLVNGIDIIYFGFSDKRMTHELFTTQSDFGNFKPEVILEFWYVLIPFLVLTFLLFRILKGFSRKTLKELDENDLPQPRLAKWGSAVLALGLMATGMRGGWQKHNLCMEMAFENSGDFYVGAVGLNSAWTILATVDWGKSKPIDLLPEKNAVETTRKLVKNSFDGPFLSEKYPLVRQTQFEEPEEKYNVVILIVESLNAYEVGSVTGKGLEESLTPNLDTLVRHARLYRNYFANGVRSVESVPGIVNSMPDIFLRPTIFSRYEQNHHWGLANILSQKGYNTSFFCGGRNGTMGFDRYSKVCGFNNYYGLDEYPNGDRDFDGLWGCLDGPFLNWMGEMQDASREPFMSVWFSTTNHHPFRMPKGERFKDIADRDITDMQKTIMYTDRVLGEYFEEVSKYDWFDRTIFMITGDHCFHEASDPKRTTMDKFHVPLFVIAPCLEPGFDDRLGTHTDVMPTVIDILKLRTFHASTGVSLLNSQKDPFVLVNLMGILTFAENNLAWSSSLNKNYPYHYLKDRNWYLGEDPKLIDDLKNEYDAKLRSAYQVFHNTRVNNTLIGPEFMKLPDSGK